MGQSQNFENPNFCVVAKVDSDLNHHRTGGRKSKTWDEIAFENLFFIPP
jgi:hypothetical protein